MVVAGVAKKVLPAALDCCSGGSLSHAVQAPVFYHQLCQSHLSHPFLVTGPEQAPVVVLFQQVNWKLFEWFALAAILANCITLAMDSNKPGFETSSLGQALHVCDLVFLGFFTVEALLKVLAAGLVLGPHTYLRNGRFNRARAACRAAAHNSHLVGQPLARVTISVDLCNSGRQVPSVFLKQQNCIDQGRYSQHL
jgi:hypothetical protein